MTTYIVYFKVNSLEYTVTVQQNTGKDFNLGVIIDESRKVVMREAKVNYNEVKFSKVNFLLNNYYLERQV